MLVQCLNLPEGDEPAFTQPLMYKQINQQPSTREIYLNRLLGDGILDDSRAQAIMDNHNTNLEEEF